MFGSKESPQEPSIFDVDLEERKIYQEYRFAKYLEQTNPARKNSLGAQAFDQPNRVAIDFS